MRRAICFAVFAALLTMPKIIWARESSLRICVVQSKEGFAYSQIYGWDAKKLAPELSTRKLLNGTLIIGVAVVGMDRKDAEAEAGRQQCVYVVQLSRYESVDEFDTNSPPDSLVRSPSPSPGYRDSIAYTLSRSGESKVILQGSAPGPIIYAKSHRQFSPFPVFATEIMAKLNKLP